MKFNIFNTMSQVKELETEKKSLLSRLETMEKDLTEAHDTIGEFMVKQKEFDTTIEATRKEYQAKLDALTVQLEEAKASAAKQAAQVLSSIGVEPETVKVEVVPTQGDIVAQFHSLTGKERSAFYQQHKETILKALGLNK